MISSTLSPPSEHAEFLQLCPMIERYALKAFRHSQPDDKLEAIAEATAAGFRAFVKLKKRGKDPARDFPTVLVRFSVLHVLNGRHVGGKASSTDVLSSRAQKKNGFRVLPLIPHGEVSHQTLYGEVTGQRTLDTYEEALQDEGRGSVPDLAAFRIDWPEFLATLSKRDRDLARFLAQGHSGKETAKRFNLTPARITQLRKQWQQEWEAFQK